MATWQSSQRVVQIPCRCSVGRSTLADLRLESPRCSSEHAAITWSKGRWNVRDLGSSNGTKINGRTLFPGDRVQLSTGSRVQFGDDAKAIIFKRGEWREGLDEFQAEELTRPARVEEYGFESNPPIQRDKAAEPAAA